MIRYYIKNIKTGCYISKTEFGEFYKTDVSCATKFTLAQALKKIQRMKHPENWDVIKVVENEEGNLFRKRTSNSRVK